MQPRLMETHMHLYILKRSHKPWCSALNRINKIILEVDAFKILH